MAAAFSSLLETTFTCEFLDSNGTVVQPYEISFTSDANVIPSYGAVAKIMGEVTRILAAINSDSSSVSARNTLRFSLENSQRPPQTFRFNTKVSGAPSSDQWFEIVGHVMDIIARFANDAKPTIAATPPMAGKQGFSPSLTSPLMANKQESAFSPPMTSPPQSASSNHKRNSGVGVLKSPTPCKLPHINDVKRFLLANPQSVAYVATEEYSELLPAVVMSSSNENTVICKLGMWRGAVEKKVRISDIILLKEVPIFARMNAYSNPPASLPNYGADVENESRFVEFLGIMEKILASSGKSVERLKVRYTRPTSRVGQVDEREDEVPIFRCTLLREGVVSDTLQKRAVQEKKGESRVKSPVKRKEIKSPVDRKEIVKPIEASVDGNEGRKSRNSKAPKRAISDAIEIAEEAPTHRRKSLRLTTNETVAESQQQEHQHPANSGKAVFEFESEDEVPLKENALLRLSRSPDLSSEAMESSPTVPHSVPRPSKTTKGSVANDDKKRRASMGNVKNAQHRDRSESRSTSRISLNNQPTQVGRGRNGARLSTTTSSGQTLKPIANLFSGEVFVVLNAGEKSTADESLSVEMVERVIRQSGGQIVELPTPTSGSKNSKIVVICKYEVSSLKYLYAIAAGIPCVSYDWVSACLEARSIVDKSSFLLPAGKDENGNVWQQRAAYSKVFNQTKIFVAARCKEFFVTWQSLLEASGAVVLPNVGDSNAAIRRHYSYDADRSAGHIDEEAASEEADATIPTCSYVLVEPDPECAPISAATNTALANKVPLITCKWLIRCFLTGRVVSPDEDPSKYTWWGSITSTAADDE